jgi:uncharacterized protein (TIGR00266 family)
MQHTILGSPSFAHIDVTLDAGETLIAESGAMASMDATLDQRARLNGNLFGAFIRKVFGRESFFLSHYSNNGASPSKIMITNKVPGDIRAVKLTGGGFFIQPGAFVACSSDIKLDVKWAGFRSWIAGEGLLRNYVHGTGSVFFGGYGAIYDKNLDGAYIVDSSHVLGYSRGITLNIQLSSGIFSSFLGGEGLVTRLEGKGKIYLQSRSLKGLAGFINPRL